MPLEPAASASVEKLIDDSDPQFPVFSSDESFVAPPEKTFSIIDAKIGEILTPEQVRERISTNVTILMDAGIYSGINTTVFENDHTAGNNHQGIRYIPEAYLNMRAQAAVYRLHSHNVAIAPSQPGSLDGIYSTDPEKTFLSLKKLADGNYEVLGITTILSKFTHGSRQLEVDWRRRLVNEAKTLGGEKVREIIELQHEMEFGDTRVFAQGTAAHPNPFVLAGIADTTVRIAGSDADVDPENKYNILEINGEKVFVIGVQDNVVTVLEDAKTGKQKFIDVAGQTLTLNNGKKIENFHGNLTPATVGRSSWKGHQEFIGALQEKVNPAMELHTILLRQPFYHMDTTGFRVGKHFFTNRAAFTEESFAKIQELMGAENVIELPLEDIGKAFGGNATAMGNNVYISDKISATAVDIITSLGYNVHLGDISYTMTNGGGQRCMTAQQYIIAPELAVAEPPKDDLGMPVKGKVFKSIINYKTGETFYGQVKSGLRYEKGTDITLDDLVFPENGPEYFRSLENGLVELHRVVVEHEAKFREAMARKETSPVPQSLVAFDKRTDYLTYPRSETTDLREFVKDWIELGYIMETFLDAAQSLVLLGQETFAEHGHEQEHVVPRVEMSDIPVKGQTPEWVINLIGDWRSSKNIFKNDGTVINAEGAYPEEASAVPDLVGVADVADAFHIPLRYTLGGAFVGLARSINWPHDTNELLKEFRRLRSDYAETVEAAIKTAVSAAGSDRKARLDAKKTAMGEAIAEWNARNGVALTSTLEQLRFRLRDPHSVLTGTVGKGENTRTFTIPNQWPINSNIPDSYPHLAILGIGGTSHGAFDEAKVPKLAYYFLSNAAGGESNLTKSALGIKSVIRGTNLDLTIGAKTVGDMQKAVDLRHRTINIMRRMLEISGTTYKQAIGDMERIESFATRKEEIKPTFPLHNKEEAGLLLYAVSAGIRQFEIAAQIRKAGDRENVNPLVAQLENVAKNIAMAENVSSFAMPQILAAAEKYIKANIAKAAEIDAQQPADKAGPMLSRKAGFELSLEVIENVRARMKTNRRAVEKWSGEAVAVTSAAQR